MDYHCFIYVVMFYSIFYLIIDVWITVDIGLLMHIHMIIENPILIAEAL